MSTTFAPDHPDVSIRSTRLHVEFDDDGPLHRWGGAAGLGGVAAMAATIAVVGTLGLPEASDPETLTDFADIEGGRIAEHFLYLAALVGFLLHGAALGRVLGNVHRPAAMFGALLSSVGLTIMAASAVLHLSTAPLADLHAEATGSDRQAVEFAWHAAQSVFDTMLVTGLLLVPIGLALLGVAMRRAPDFGPAIGAVAIGLGAFGLLGAVAETLDPASDYAAAGVLALVAFHLIVGWRTLALGRSRSATSGIAAAMH